MKTNNKNKKGYTLVELVIVLAVLAIAATMAVSFSTMIHSAQSISRARHEALQEVKVAEALIEGFIERNAKELLVTETTSAVAGEKLFVENENNTAVFLNNAGAFYVDGNGVIFFEYIENIEFTIERYFVLDGNVTCVTPYLEIVHPTTKETIQLNYRDAIDTLYYCTVTYVIAESQHTYTFCVNPYIGEEIGGNR